MASKSFLLTLGEPRQIWASWLSFFHVTLSHQKLLFIDFGSVLGPKSLGMGIFFSVQPEVPLQPERTTKKLLSAGQWLFTERLPNNFTKFSDSWSLLCSVTLWSLWVGRNDIVFTLSFHLTWVMFELVFLVEQGGGLPGFPSLCTCSFSR
jgi:hypothetical protein